MLRSEQFVMGVCLDLNGSERYGDNYFDLFPGQPYFVPSRCGQKPELLYCLNNFKIRKEKGKDL